MVKVKTTTPERVKSVSGDFPPAPREKTGFRFDVKSEDGDNGHVYLKRAGL